MRPGEHAVTRQADYEPTRRPFGPDSVWNRRVDKDTQLDPNSGPLMATLLQEVQQEQTLGVGPAIGFKRSAVAEYVVPADQPTMRVELTNPRVFWRRSLARAFRRVPLPASAHAAPGNDGHLVIWQPSKDRMWEFFHFRRQGRRRIAEWGGALKHVSRSPGYYTRSSWPGARISWGATASSLSVAGGVMLISELRRHLIPHALAMALPSPRAGVWSWPAQRTDGRDPNAGVLPEGAHLRLDPQLDIDSLGLDPTTAAIARAAQRYGMIVRDQTGLGITFYAEDPGQYERAHGRSPYPAIWQHETTMQLLDRFPWQYVQVLPMRLCSNHKRPCPPPKGRH